MLTAPCTLHWRNALYGISLIESRMGSAQNSNSPMQSSPVGPVADRRRANRPALEWCPACGGSDAKVVLRTDFVVYARCPDCGDVRAVPKPGVNAALFPSDS